MKKKGLSLTNRGIALISALLLAANALLAAVLVNQSRTAMRAMIHDRMLDISNTAAAMLDGDALEALTAEDQGAAPYEAALDVLRVFQENSDLRYIYCVRRVGAGRFIFTVDPTADDPAEFGQTAAWTEALEAAADGVAGADDTPYRDAWGSFYSAYSPVLNARGEVAGVVAVDFSADELDRQMANQTRTIVAGCALSLVVGVLLVLLVTGRLRSQLRTLNGEMRNLTSDVEALSRQVQIPLSHGYPARQSGSGESYSLDEIGELGEKIRKTQRELQAYVGYVKGQAFTDTLTGAGNHTAYQDAVKKLSGKISTNMADFHIVVFDVNGLKTVNDRLGHEVGDQLLRDAAGILKRVFGDERVFRIGGDEFIAVLEKVPAGEVQAMYRRMDEALEVFNQSERRYDIPLAISRGAAAYQRGVDRQYKEIFRRADEAMYRDKGEFYKKMGNEGAKSAASRPDMPG